MILINYYPGTLGFLIVKTLFLHFSDRLSKNFKPNNLTVNKLEFSNHDVCPDLALSDCSHITDNKMKQLIQVTTMGTSLVTVHNILLLPSNILDSSLVVNVECNSENRIEATLLYWIKTSGQVQFEYVINRNKTMNFYHAVLAQIIVCFERPFETHSSGIFINFNNLGNSEKVKTMLLDIAKHMSFDPVEFNEDWYMTNYNRSIKPLVLHADLLNMFRVIYYRMQQFESRLDYSEFFNKTELQNFKILIDEWFIKFQKCNK